ncbi:permease [Gorillibacterium sp. sgz5001074]|uniref:permease n=1 Tax=Gorillibacterium sp. sgz5001074 TaxID=3446695 RepID=UPI003F66A4B0
MPNWILRWAPPLLGAASCAMLLLILTTRPVPGLGVLREPAAAKMLQGIFIGIVLEALPFILLGVLVSAVLHLFVPEAAIRRLIPRNPVLGVLFACTLGFLFPVCECGMIPVIRRLLGKGMPVYIAVVFVLAGPVLNPVTFASTYMAFRGEPSMAYVRLALAFAVAACVGLALHRLMRGNVLRHSASQLGHAHGDHGHPHHGHEHHGHEHHGHSHAGGLPSRLGAVLGHASDEFFEMGKYLILGAGITAVVQTFVPADSLASIGQAGWGAHMFMAAFAFALSLCSTSDAFVAATFSPSFNAGSLLTFLLMGPMVSFKGTLMLLTVFKGRFVLMVSAMATLLLLAASAAAAFFGWV